MGLGREASRVLACRVASPVVVAVACAVVLTACNGSENDQPEPSPTSGPTSPTTPSAEPADGPVLDLESFTVRVPAGWDRREQIVRNSESASSDDALLTAYDSDVTTGDELDQQAKRALKDERDFASDVRRLDDVELDGTAAWAIEGRVDGSTREYTYGTEAYDHAVTLTLTIKNDVRENQRDELVQSILSSFEWTTG